MTAPFDGVRVFSVTLRHERGQIGDAITAWLAQTKVELVEILVRQSSDAAYHCLSFIVFYRSAKAADRAPLVAAR